MEETLGKRIVASRKRLGLTQDALAEQLGVTAQAVSKWENDQSCPDITMLPKLAQVFGITTDALLGLERQEAKPAELVPSTAETDNKPEGLHIQNGQWEFQWDGGRRSGVGIGVWVLLVGALMILGELGGVCVGFFDLLWPTGLLVFGLFGIYPRFSILRLGCALLGAGFLLDLLECIPFSLDLERLLPIILLLVGVHLVVNALGKPKHGNFRASRSGTNKNHCTYNGETFDCAGSFGEYSHNIQLPRLSGGHADISFGELTVDLSGCEELAENCRLELNCAFGELEILVPRKWKAAPFTSTAFGSVETKGCPSDNADAVLSLDCNVSFGEITIRYI